nr:MAG TPA: hypothetical protein [Caudoviricetes sp.]
MLWLIKVMFNIIFNIVFLAPITFIKVFALCSNRRH